MADHAAQAKQRPFVAVGEIVNGQYSFDDVLASGDTISETPTVVELDSSDLLITLIAGNTVALTIAGAAVPIGRAVTWRMRNQLAATRRYTLKITVVTAYGETRVRRAAFRCVD